jgi:predicted GTPase
MSVKSTLVNRFVGKKKAIYKNAGTTRDRNDFVVSGKIKVYRYRYAGMEHSDINEFSKALSRQLDAAISAAI